jgi:protein-arginine kinase
LSYTRKESRLVAIQIHRNVSEWVYRISPDDACTIQRRRVARGYRWEHFRWCDTAEEAREIILLMEEEMDK